VISDSNQRAAARDGAQKGTEEMRYTGTIRSSWRSAAVTTAGTIALCLTAAVPALRAQISTYGPKGLPAMNTQMGPQNATPTVLDKVGIDQRLNTELPLNLTFTDDMGRLVPLGSYFGKRPAILALVYYQCPMLCSEELNGLVSALQMVRFVPGKDFDIVVVSIDPSEGTDLAAAKKRTYLTRYGHPETAAGWHFLTGTQPNIDALTRAVGFRYVRIPGPDGKLTQFAHASAIQIVTPEGKLAQYYMGVEYSPKDLLLGLDEASSNRIGSPVDNILTYCYHYDPKTNTHSLIVSRVVQLGGLLTMVLLGGFMTVMFRRDYRQDHPAGTETHGTGKKVNG
jgi:protein SCO1/2